MKKKYLEPELEKLVIVTQLMGENVVLSDPEHGSFSSSGSRKNILNLSLKSWLLLRS